MLCEAKSFSDYTVTTPPLNTQLKPMPPSRKGCKQPPSQRSEARDLQRAIMEMQKRTDLKPAELSALSRAWCDCAEQLRKIDMKPLPRSIDVSKLGKRGRRQAPQALAEPAEPGLGAPPIPQE